MRALESGPLMSHNLNVLPRQPRRKAAQEGPPLLGAQWRRSMPWASRTRSTPEHETGAPSRCLQAASLAELEPLCPHLSDGEVEEILRQLIRGRHDDSFQGNLL